MFHFTDVPGIGDGEGDTINVRIEEEDEATCEWSPDMGVRKQLINLRSDEEEEVELVCCKEEEIVEYCSDPGSR